MRASEIEESVMLCMQADVSAMIWGESGVGKSGLGKQIAKRTSRIPIDIRAMLFDPVDLRGVPDVSNHRTRWNPSGFLPLQGDKGKYLIILEELNRAPQSMMNALLQLVLDKSIGEFKLADDTQIISCCNPTGRGVTPLSEAMSNRFTHLTMTVDLDDWCRWAAMNGIEPSLIAFMRFRESMLFMANTKACPRQWEAVSKLQQQNPPKHLEFGLYAGTVDEGQAVEYLSFLKMFRECAGLIDSILLNPTSATVPTEPSTLFAVSSALARRASVKTFDRIVQYSKRLPAEFAVYCVKDAVRREDSLRATPAFNTWAIDNASVVF